MILLDTNVLVYALDADAPQYKESRRIIEAALRGRIPGVMVPQVLVEAYAILTDAKRVKRPLPLAVAWQEMETYRLGLPVLPWHDRTLNALGDLLTQVEITGPDVFDAMLVAQMEAHGLRTVCTYNRDDFRRFRGLQAETPGTIARQFHLG